MLQRQAKVLRAGQIRAVLNHIQRTRHPVRNRVIFLLSLRAGLRAKEIAGLEWRMITDAEGQIAEAQINAIVEQQEVMRRLREQRIMQSRTQGRVTSFLESKREGDEEDLTSQRQLLRHRIVQLESRLSGEEFEDRLRNAESNIADYMTSYAHALELEHAEGRTRLDFRRLTVVADTPNGAIRLDQMGSGDNWVVCHVITHVALHRWFRTRNRPVPAFLILDQPSKAHYPPSEEFEPNTIEDDDRKAVARLFKFLYDRASRDGFQIIVVDHADEPDDWFRNAVVERWRGGEKLVPDEWPEA